MIGIGVLFKVFGSIAKGPFWGSFIFQPAREDIGKIPTNQLISCRVSLSCWFLRNPPRSLGYQPKPGSPHFDPTIGHISLRKYGQDFQRTLPRALSSLFLRMHLFIFSCWFLKGIYHWRYFHIFPGGRKNSERWTDLSNPHRI